MIQALYTNDQLYEIAKESYDNMVRFCDKLDQEGYWKEPEAFLEKNIYEMLNLFLQSVLLNLCVYCGQNGETQRRFIMEITSENTLGCTEEGDLPEEVLVLANKILRNPPIILQLCGLRDMKKQSFFSSYFVDGLVNVMLCCSLLNQSQSPYADKFISEFYEKTACFIEEEQKRYVIDARYLFLKLSSEKFSKVKAAVENLKQMRIEKEHKEAQQRLQEENTLLNAKEVTKLMVEKELQENNNKERTDGGTDIEEDNKNEKEVAENISDADKREEEKTSEKEGRTEGDEAVVTEKTTVDYSDEELLKLQQLGKLKISTPKMDAMRQEHERAKRRIEDEKVQKIRNEINRINQDRQLHKFLEELQELIGLDTVKKEIQSLINLIKVKKMRESYNMPAMDITYHMVFTGNPGTGKTTVARLVAQIYKELGILSKGHLVEVDRSGLVAGYVGQTAMKVKEVVEKAMGGILFIDEAYALSNKNDANDFGSEAIDTLVKMMEDHRDDLVVIVAGYKKEMEMFLKANTGLISRFNKFIDFEDYTNEELMRILDLFAEKAGVCIDEDARTEIYTVLQNMAPEKKALFGNGRGIRNTFESIMGKQADRIVLLETPTEEQLKNIIREDVLDIIS